MATTRCWLKSEIKAMFKEIGGKGKIAKIAKMSSAEREALFAKYSDAEAGKDFNLEFEKMLVIPKQQEAIKKWMEKTGKTEAEYVPEHRKKRMKRFVKMATDKDNEGLAIRQPPMNDLVSRINRMEQVLNPTKDIAFLESLAKQRLGFEITQADAAEVFNVAKKVNDNRTKMMDALNADKKGKAYLDPLESIKLEDLSDKQKKAIDDYAQSMVDFQNTYDEIYLKTRTDTFFGRIAGFIKSLKASGDLSATFNQLGIVVQPLLLKSIAMKLGLDVGKLKDPDNIKDLKIQMRKNIFAYKKTATIDPSAVLKELYSRPNFLNGNYTKAHIDVGIREEAYPSALMNKLEAGEAKRFIGKIVGKTLAKIGSPFTRSENAYNLAIQVSRADMFDLQYALNDGNKEMFSGDNIKRMGDMINNATGRGKTFTDPKLNKHLSSNFFSIKFLSARIRIAYDLIAGVRYTGEKLLDMSWNNLVSNTAFGNQVAKLFGKESFGELSLSERDAIQKLHYSTAFKFMASAWTISFLVNLLGHALLHDDPDWWRDFFDPTSTDFGKIRVGTVHWDCSIGINALFVMLARGVLGTRKTQAGTYQKTDWGDLLWNFILPKTAPVVQTVLDTQKVAQAWAKGKKTPESYGSKIFGGHWWLEQFVPMSLMNIGDAIYDAAKDKSWGTFALEGLSAAGDFFGISSSTYEDRAYNGYDTTQRTYLRALVAATGEEPPKMKLDSSCAIMKNLEGEKQEKAVAEFQLRWGKELDKTIHSARFLRLPPKEQMKELKAVRSNVMNDVAIDSGAKKKK